MSFNLLFIVTGIVVGLLTGGNLRCLAELPLRRLWLLGLGMLLRFPLMFSEPFSQATRGWVGAGLQISGLVAILAFALSNRHLRGSFLVSLGILLTLTAITANSGYMPGSDELYLALLKYYGMTERAAAFEAGLMNYHTTSLTSETRLWFLTDVIPIPRITVAPFVVSIGDVLVGIGMFLVVLWGMHTREQRSERSLP
ncbi:MAG: DUF5317 domain-containing protein [Anaerolineae bacterium]